MYFKIVIGNYILAVGDNIRGIEINEAEYQQIMLAMQNKPIKEDYYYKLRDDDKNWDEFEIIPETQPLCETYSDETNVEQEVDDNELYSE